MNNITEEIKNRSIYSVISAFMKLQKTSSTKFKGLCPFHKEKTPSFVVDEEKKFFKCFGCGEGGDVIRFVEKTQNLTFVHAIEFLCNFFSINMNKVTPSEHRASTKSLELLSKINTFFQQMLTTHSEAKEYLLRRQISQGSIKKFQLGFCPNRKIFSSFIAENGISLHDCLALGLAAKKGENVYFLFEERITFPIFNTKNQIIAFGSRTISNQTPKYINSKETLFFSKRKTIYNLQNIAKNKTIIVVEGYMDVIALDQLHLEEGVCATLGTGISTEHIMAILGYSNDVIFAFDNDNAGRVASLKATEKILPILKPGMKIYFIQISEGKDFDDLTKIRTREQIISIIRASKQEMHTYIFAQVLQKYDIKNFNQKISLQSELESITKQIKDKITAKAYRDFFNQQIFKLQYQKINVPTHRIDKTSNVNALIEELTAIKSLNYDEIENIQNVLVQYLNPKHLETINRWLDSTNVNKTDSHDVKPLILQILSEVLKDPKYLESQIKRRSLMTLLLTLDN